MTKQRNSYSREFKLEAINMVTEHKHKIWEVTLKIGIGKSTLQKWLSQYRKEQQGITPIGSKTLTEEQREIQRLRSENKQLKMERDILKKASALLAQDNLNVYR